MDEQLRQLLNLGKEYYLKRDFPYSGYPVVSTSAPLVVSSGWGNGATQFDGYYYYYEFVVKALACESARMPVTITVDPKPSPSFTANRIGGTVTTVTASHAHLK